MVSRDEQKTTIHEFLRVRKSTMSRDEGKEMKQTGLECQSDLPTHVAASCLPGLVQRLYAGNVSLDEFC